MGVLCRRLGLHASLILDLWQTNTLQRKNSTGNLRTALRSRSSLRRLEQFCAFGACSLVSFIDFVRKYQGPGSLLFWEELSPFNFVRGFLTRSIVGPITNWSHVPSTRDSRFTAFGPSKVSDTDIPAPSRPPSRCPFHQTRTQGLPSTQYAVLSEVLFDTVWLRMVGNNSVFSWLSPAGSDCRGHTDRRNER